MEGYGKTKYLFLHSQITDKKKRRKDYGMVATTNFTEGEAQMKTFEELPLGCPQFTNTGIFVNTQETLSI